MGRLPWQIAAYHPPKPASAHKQNQMKHNGLTGFGGLPRQMKLMKRPSSGRKSLTVHRKELAATILDCLIDGASDEFGQQVRLLLFLAAHSHVIPNMLSLVAESNPAAQWHR
jgi:hypothetical protein